MKFSTIARHIREGFRNVFRNGWMSFASISSIAVSLFILGVFLLLSLNLNKIADQLDSQAQVTVFLRTDIEQAKIDEVERVIKRIPEVKQVTFVSKVEGLERFRQSMGDEGKEALEGYEEDTNPLPDKFEIDVFEPQKINLVVKQIEAINLTDPEQPITKLKYGKEAIERLFKITNAIRNFGLFIVIGLAVMAMFLIATTIKMTILARRREIGIMKLVGATNGFIRWPFFIEGALIGFIGSTITSILLLYGYTKLMGTGTVAFGLYQIQTASIEEVKWLVGGLLVALGTVLGVWGSTLSVRKYLKV
ncbi:MAG: permease-like cell division protein FtsX [Candidatus Cohnella colombiensis]|uniref:Cell division protein FtsX n=1 Tax=Candidatus Cohnella colombiensis TaxID=3121368 RepID=A0AA95EUT8_9BACL|nr:MAG: permease-like cell division protein FtsX [Cohnella sp.]